MTRRPRVLYLCGWPIGARGQGAVSFVYEQIEALASCVEAAYIEPHFVSMWSWPWRRLSAGAVTPIRDLWPRDVAAMRVPVPRAPVRLTGHTLLRDIERAGSRIAAAVARHWGPVDLVHAHVVLPAGVFGASIARALGVPFILQEHSGPFDMHLDTTEKVGAVRRVLDAASVVAVVGPTLGERVRELASRAGAICVTPNLVRTDLFRPQAIPHDRRTLRLVTVGSLHPVKGLDVLVDAVARLVGMGHAVELRVVGDGALRQPLLDQIARLRLEGRVQLVGALPRAETARAVAEAHVYVCASRCETFGIAPAEALSVGRPVVTTRCGGPDAYVDASCGAVVPVDRPDAIAEAVLATWARIDEFEPGALHRRIDAQFGLEAFRARMLGLYDRVLGDARAA
ncbi:MAG: glycosyltransferase [Gemmatimonadaceae bacterium]|nr:glycosyltransferase [Gemmatimonadaceae bacterium]